MGSDLVFPRTIYRGHPDHLGQGPHAHPETGELVGETKRCESPDAFEQDARDGWRLTRERVDVDAFAAPDVVDPPVADPAADAAKSKKKK